MVAEGVSVPVRVVRIDSGQQARIAELTRQLTEMRRQGNRFAHAEGSPWGTPRPRNYLTWFVAYY